MDDILGIHHNSNAVLQWLHKSFPLKQGFENSDMYLGTNLPKTRLHNGVWAWTISPAKFVQEAVRNFAFHLAANYCGRVKLPKKAENPRRWVMIQSWIPIQTESQMQQCMSWPITMFLRNVIGQSSIGMPRRLYPQMSQNTEIRRLISKCL